jgi:hypothetical protein
MDSEDHSDVSDTQRLKLLEVKYVFMAQSLQGQSMTIETSSLSRHILDASFLHSTYPLLLVFVLV